MPVHRQVSRLSAFVARVFYRLELAGSPPPADGPLLVVANHPNSLLDPALVTLAVGRPARFLAKAPLFTDVKVGWLVRASGAIPVHRKQDGAVPEGGNDDTFRAAEAALIGGDAIALFPEGISHDNPALAPLKTGAARLALGTAAKLGRAFPLVPVGITLDDRAIFRSRGLIVVGAPITWDDLADEAARDTAAPLAPPRVRALTARLADALRDVTVSYASWEDARLVALAEAVHDSADGSIGDGAERLGRQRLGAALLERVRTSDAPHAAGLRAEVAALADDLRRHERLLHALGLTPSDLMMRTDARTAFGWAARRAHLVALGTLAALGTVLGWVPYRAAGRIAGLIPGSEATDVLATSKALVGGACFLVWTLLLAAAAGWLGGPWAAVLVLVLVPPLLLLTVLTNEGWQDAWRDARRFLTLRRSAGRAADLRGRQAELARRVEGVVERLEGVARSA